MKQKVEREIMNDRVSTHAFGRRGVYDACVIHNMCELYMYICTYMRVAGIRLVQRGLVANGIQKSQTRARRLFHAASRARRRAGGVCRCCVA